MVLSLIVLFLTSMSLSFVEERLMNRDKIVIYIILGVAMILIAGLRAVGATPDTITYEGMYYAKDNNVTILLTEPSFNFIRNILHSFSLDVNALFLTYAALSIPLHLTAFWKISKLPFLTLTIYISYYYMMHDMVQMRCAVASGLFLWAIYCYVNNRKWLTALFIAIGILFHYSAAAGFVIFLLSDKMTKWHKMALYTLVPIGIVVYFAHIDISSFIPDELGGAKLARYRELNEKGLDDLQEGWKFETNILIWMNIVLYYASIYYHDFLKEHFKYTTIAIKLQAVGFCFLFFVYALSKVIANRMNDYFSVASILLWTASFYAFYPKFVSRVINNAISTLRFVTSMLGYALSLLWM